MSSVTVAKGGATQSALTSDWIFREIASKDTQLVLGRMQQLSIAEPPSQLRAVQVGQSLPADALEQQIFDALARAKIHTSVVAMHLDPGLKERLFRKLNALHEVDEWQDGDKPILFASFEAFIRMIIDLKPSVAPSLGLSQEGHVIAVWLSGRDRLTIEFMEKRAVRMVFSIDRDGSAERAAVEAHVDRISAILAPFDASRWFMKHEV
jgi:hypothetical protein